MKNVRLGINGFGRIGRVATRIAWEREGIKVVAINSRADRLSHVHLLKYDSTYGVFNHRVETDNGSILIDGEKVRVFRQNDPSQIPWREARVNIVLEATGAFCSFELAKKHLSAGCKRVIITAPAKGDLKTFCLGVNQNQYDPARHYVVSNASCTTNCLAPVAKVLDDAFGIVRGFMTTVHSYTDSQNLLDNSHKKNLRLARSATNNIIPTTTGASQALGKVLPQLAGKIKSQALRVPTSTVSLIDLVVQVEKKTNVEAVNHSFAKAAKLGLKGILDITFLPLVSTDIKGSTLSALVDGSLTQVSGSLVNVKAWYDNEWGYATRLIDLVVYIAKKGV